MGEEFKASQQKSALNGCGGTLWKVMKFGKS